MSLSTAGFELALNLLTDATNGINYIGVEVSGGTAPAKQAITFNAASGGLGSGDVTASSTPHTFAIPANALVTGVKLYHDTVVAALINVSPDTDSNDYNYVVDTLTITMT